MCEVCAIFGAGEHWSDFSRERNERYPFADILHYRSERRRRLALIGRCLAVIGAGCGDWDGETSVVFDPAGRQRLAPTLGDIWEQAEALTGQAFDPLAPEQVLRG